MFRRFVSCRTGLAFGFPFLFSRDQGWKDLGFGPCHQTGDTIAWVPSDGVCFTGFAALTLAVQHSAEKPPVTWLLAWLVLLAGALIAPLMALVPASRLRPALGLSLRAISLGAGFAFGMIPVLRQSGAAPATAMAEVDRFAAASMRFEVAQHAEIEVFCHGARL